MRIRSNPTLLILTAMLQAVVFLPSCVRDTTKPEEEPEAWIDVPIPPIIRLDASVIAADRHGALFVGGDSDACMWRSTDRGMTWTQKTAGLIARRPVTALLVKGDGTVFAALQGAGVFISRNRGESWTQVNNHLTDLDVQSLIAAADGSIIAATSRGKIFRSRNDGGIWIEVRGDPIWSRVTALVTDSEGVIYAGSLGQGVFFSADSGLTWSPSSDSLDSPYVVSLAIRADGSILGGTWADGVYRSAGPGAPWERIDGGAIPDVVLAIAIDESGTIFAGTHEQGIFRSRDGGDSWERSDAGLQGLGIHSLLCANSFLLAGTGGEGVFRSTDGGSSWSLPRNYCPEDPSHYEFYNRRRSLSIDGSGTYYLLTEFAIYRSRDGGETWSRVSGDISDRFTCLILHPNSSLIVGAWGGIYISDDSGDSWAIADTSSAGREPVYTLEVSPNGTVFGWTNNGVIRFSDGCSSWESVLDETMITAIGTGSAGSVYAGTAFAGLFASNDYGDTWQRMTDSLHVNSLEADLVGNVFLLSSTGILCSSDEGKTWRSIDPEEGSNPPRHIIPNDPRGIVAAPGGEIAIIYDPSTFHASEDCFESWKTETVPFGYEFMYLSPDGYLYVVEPLLSVMHRSRRALY